MKPRQYVAYYRVSSPVQGCSGLSLEGQREAVRRFIVEEHGQLVAEFSEVRSGLKSAGTQLREALRTCRMHRATLAVASVDRLSRRMALISAVIDSDIRLAVVDSPDASRVVLHVKAAWAEYESTLRSERVRAALAEAKKRGVQLGGRRPIEDMRAMAVLGHHERKAVADERAMRIAPLVWRLRDMGKTLAEIATELNWRSVPTEQGRRWHSTGIGRLLQRTERQFPWIAADLATRPNWRVVRAQARAERVAPLVWQMLLAGKSINAVAEELNRLNVPTPRGRSWCKEKVRNALARGRAVLEVGYQVAVAQAARPPGGQSFAWAFAAAPIVWRMKLDGLTRCQTAAELRRRGLPTARGGRWTHKVVSRVMAVTKSAFPDPAIPAAA